MTTLEFIFFGILVVIILIVSLFLGKALGRSQAVRLEIHKDQADEKAGEDVKNLHQRVLKLQADVHLHVNDPEAFSDLLDLGDGETQQDKDCRD